tara:strand:- start:1948 stop:2382 length:435 start_codon:yes stop_codon:yes gene_type:complete
MIDDIRYIFLFLMIFIFIKIIKFGVIYNIIYKYYIEGFTDESYIKYNGISGYTPRLKHDYDIDKLNKPLYPYLLGDIKDYHRIGELVEPNIKYKKHNIKNKDMLYRPYYTPIVTDNDFFYKHYKNHIAYDLGNKNWKLQIDTIY